MIQIQPYDPHWCLKNAAFPEDEVRIWREVSLVDFPVERRMACSGEIGPPQQLSLSFVSSIASAIALGSTESTNRVPLVWVVSVALQTELSL